MYVINGVGEGFEIVFEGFGIVEFMIIGDDDGGVFEGDVVGFFDMVFGDVDFWFGYVDGDVFDVVIDGVFCRVYGVSVYLEYGWVEFYFVD